MENRNKIRRSASILDELKVIAPKGNYSSGSDREELTDKQKNRQLSAAVQSIAAKRGNHSRSVGSLSLRNKPRV